MQPVTTPSRLFRSQRLRVICHHLQPGRLVLLASAIAVLMASFAWAQFSTDAAKKKPILRSVAVVEWTGPAGKPTASRLIPIAVFTNDAYMDGGLYLAQPAPLALLSGTEYILQKSGIPQGYYDLSTAGKNNGDWFGYGTWKPVPVAVHKLHASTSTHRVGEEDADRPHFGNDARKAESSGSGTQTQSAPVDSDRPTLRRRSADSVASNSNATVTSAPTAAIDPDRPRLSYGKPAELGHADLAQLKISVPHMQQMVAVSDSVDREPHPFAYEWSTPDQKAAMQQKVQALAQKILQQTQLRQPIPAAKPSASPVRHRPATPHKLRTVAPVPLENVHFECYALTYANNPTFVYSANTSKAGAPKRYITLIVQPDIYGDPQLVMQSVTDDNHLDAQPRMKLVDAVDANASNRAELLFEMDGQSQRQFALYLVTQGLARQVFITGPLPL